MCFRHYAHECGIHIERMNLCREGEHVHLLNATPAKIMTFWKDAMKERMRQGARRSRRVFEGLEHANIRVSVGPATRKVSPWRQELVGLLTDSLWTKHRKEDCWLR